MEIVGPLILQLEEIEGGLNIKNLKKNINSLYSYNKAKSARK